MFDSSGRQKNTIGKNGRRNPEFNFPHVYDVDTNDLRVQSCTISGEFLRSFGSYGSGKSQLILPKALALVTIRSISVTPAIIAFKCFILIEASVLVLMAMFLAKPVSSDHICQTWHSRDPQERHCTKFTSKEFAEFANRWQFTHTTSSPLFPSSNGQAEPAVKAVKHLLKKADDPFLALLSYRATPLPCCGKSPAEHLMGRKIRSTLPQTTYSLVSQWLYLEEFKHANEMFKDKKKANYDRRHRVRDLPEIPENTDVGVTNGHHTTDKIVSTANTPQCYIIQTPSGEIWRNRSQLNNIPCATETPTKTARNCSPIFTRSRTGTAVIPPNRLVAYRKRDVVLTVNVTHY